MQHIFIANLSMIEMIILAPIFTFMFKVHLHKGKQRLFQIYKGNLIFFWKKKELKKTKYHKKNFYATVKKIALVITPLKVP